MTVFYTVTDDDAMEGSIAFPTIKAARDAGYRDGITKITTVKMPARELACAIFNRDGFAAEYEDIA